MRKVLLSSVAVVALVALRGPAFSADLVAYSDDSASPAIPSAASWTGVYFGVQSGWSVGNTGTESSYGSGWLENDIDVSGAVFGGQLGFDYDTGHGLVLGVQGAFAGADGNGIGLDEYEGIDSSGYDTTRIAALASVTGRVGWNGHDPATLFYARGGWAWASINHGWAPSSYDYTYTGSASRSGWTVGAGVEKMLPFWSGARAFAEVNYYDFGSGSVDVDSSYDVTGRYTATEVKVGLNLDISAMHGEVAPAAAYGQPRVVDWTGCYIGVHSGWAVADTGTESSYGSGWLENDIDASGGLSGAQIGCNYDIGHGFVFGVQAAYAGADINGFALDEYYTTSSSGYDSTKIDALASVTGRVGWHGRDPSTLFYARGGWAWAHVEHGWVPSSYDYAYTGSASRNGWTVGAGVEKMLPFWPGASLFAEFNYYDFGTGDVASNSSDDVEGGYAVSEVKVGFNVDLAALHDAQGAGNWSENSEPRDWTGCFVGVHGGWGLGDTETDSSWPYNDIDVSGALFGGQLGCDVAVGHGLVVGVQGAFAGADFSGMGLDYEGTDGSMYDTTRVDALASVTGRVGWHGKDSSTLFYARGGWAWAHVEHAWVPSSYAYAYTGSASRTGWTIGGGVEKVLPFWQSASVFAEANYYDFGEGDVENNSSYDISGRYTVGEVKVGLNLDLGKILDH